MKLEQRALRFHCAGNALIGIVDVPERPLVRGLLILADSSQYRAGSHRQFTLLSRLLAARGVAVMRFDRAGAGDSEGQPGLQGADDIGAAMKEFFIHVPEMKESVILAGGDAAAGAARYAAADARVTGLALLDPLLPLPPQAAAGFGGRVLLVCPGTGTPSQVAAQVPETRHPHSRRVALAHVGKDLRRSVWRDAVAFACASWLGSW